MKTKREQVLKDIEEFLGEARKTKSLASFGYKIGLAHGTNIAYSDMKILKDHDTVLITKKIDKLLARRNFKK
ncbi:MAG: hypothetical protein AABY22_15900 [Nanoarchaeota archaeon]